MTIALPASPYPAMFTPRRVSYSNDLTSPLGGDTQRLLRLGSRWAVDVVLPQMTRADAEYWLGPLIAAERDTALLNWKQPPAGVGTPGAPVVNGAGQTGATLNLSGLTPGYNLNIGQFFSFVTGGRRYVQMVTSLSVADGSGHAAASVWPLLRVSPADGDTVEISQPKIEGLISNFDSFPIDVWNAEVVNLKFTITEQK